MGNTSDRKLNFNEFEESSKEDWQLRVQTDLRDTPLTTLDWKPFPGNENIRIEPYYSNEELTALDYLQEFHYSRINRKGWKSFVPVDNQRPDFYEHIEAAFDAGVHGIVVKVNESNLLAKQLDRISHPNLEVSVDIENSILSAESIAELGNDQNLRHLISRTNSVSIEVFKRLMAIESNWKSICISSSQSSIDLQLLDYLNNLSKIFQHAISAEINFEEVSNHIFIYSRTGSEFFLEIAKLRALRILIKAFLSAYSANNSREVEIVSVSDSYINQEYEPHESVIKSTYAGMSSILGGCNTLIIEPHENSELMLGVSVQISNILKEEAYFDKVSDPGAGSYYIESLTHKLITTTWNKFIQTQNSPI